MNVWFAEFHYIFILLDCDAGARFLKNISVPSVNLPQSSVDTSKLLDEKVNERRIRLETRLENVHLITEKE